MKIVGLDTATMDQGDMNWEPIKALGKLQLYPRSGPDEIVTRAKDAQVMSLLPKLKYVGLTSTGTNAVDLVEADKRGIAVTNVPGYASNSVAQHAMALILHFASKIGFYDEQVLDEGIVAYHSIKPESMSIQESMARAPELLSDAAEEVVKRFIAN